MNKFCSKCKTNKAIEFFRFHKKAIWCKECENLASKTYYRSNKEKCHLVSKLWASKNKDKINAISRRRNLKRRMRALQAYGGIEPKCACCNEKELKFLGIDHIYGGGTQDRKNAKGANFYSILRRKGYPEGFQVLCHNCNLAKGFYGICPHKV